MAAVNIAINSGTGSNTTASGDGTAVNVSGTLAATHANTTVNITDAVALGSVPVDGTAALWVSSSSGRQWSAITAISGSSGAWVVTVQRAFANTESGKSWAIGGKRATISGSTKVFTDFEGDWTIDIQDAQTLTAALVITPTNASAGHPSIVTSSTGATTPTLVSTSTASIRGFDLTSATHLTLSNINLKSTGTTPADGIVPVSGHADFLTFSNMVIDGWNIGINAEDGAFFNLSDLTMDRLEIKNCVGRGFSGLTSRYTMANSYVHNNGGDGAAFGQGSQGNVAIDRCVFANNTGYGLTVANATMRVSNCNFDSNTKSGLLFSTGDISITIKDNIFWGNGTSGNQYGVELASANMLDAYSIHNNAYGNNRTAARGGGFPVGVNDVTLTANPWVSGTDYALNSTAGGGVSCKGAGSTLPNITATATAPDIGAIPTGGGAAAGGGVLVYSNSDTNGGHA